MIQRLLNYYKRASNDADKTLSQIWSRIVCNHQCNLKSALDEGSPDKLKAALENIFASGELHGIEDKSPLLRSDARYAEHIERLAQRIGIIPIPNPEQPCEFKQIGNDEMQTAIEAVLGFKLETPKCLGLTVEVPHRFIFYCSAAFTIKLLFGGSFSKRILEIGAGLGNLGDIANRLGSSSYTIIDIPTVSVIQAYYLSKCVGEHAVWLYGEPWSETCFCRIFPSTNFSEAGHQTYDLVFNSDSLPEMTKEVQDGYLQLIANCLSGESVFLSINHESTRGEQSSVHDAVNRQGRLKLLNRYPFMMRDGYVEEIYKL